MVNNHYRWDFIGLSTDDKPTSETSEKVVNGSTFYCSDTSKLYVYCDGTWYERKALGGGGGSITPVQTTGASTTDVMSQNAVTSMVYADPSTTQKVNIGGSIDSSAEYGTVVGYQASISSRSDRAVVIGYRAGAETPGSVALGTGASPTRTGEVNIGSFGSTAYGFNKTNYRVLGGVYDGQSAHDAVTVSQVNSVIDAINTALSTNIPHIGA